MTIWQGAYTTSRRVDDVVPRRMRLNHRRLQPGHHRVVAARGHRAAGIRGSDCVTASAGPSSTAASGDFGLSMVVDALVAPFALVAAPDGTSRSFVVDQTRTIHILVGNELRPRTVLDLSDRIVRLDREYDECACSLAFHPDYATNGRFFVYYGAAARPGAAAGDDRTDTLSEFRVSSN